MFIRPTLVWAEFDHPIPPMETMSDVLNYIKFRAGLLKQGEWIQVQYVFITRLREQRYPNRGQLDGVAPNNPVVFSTGPDASLNSLALKLSGIDKNFRVADVTSRASPRQTAHRKRSHPKDLRPFWGL
jgi:predicted amidohydrolase YtcJ